MQKICFYLLQVLDENLLQDLDQQLVLFYLKLDFFSLMEKVMDPPERPTE